MYGLNIFIQQTFFRKLDETGHKQYNKSKEHEKSSNNYTK